MMTFRPTELVRNDVVLLIDAALFYGENRNRGEVNEQG
jgi:hypothetical protein